MERVTGFVRRHGELVALLGFFCCVAVAVLGVRWGRLAVDARPDLYLDPAAVVRESLHAWASVGSLGSANYDTGYLPVALVASALREVGIPAWLTMRLLRLLLYVVAGLGARAFVRQTGVVTSAGRLIATVLYVVNPYVLVGALTLPVMLPYALFPWLLVALRRSFGEEKRWGGVGWFGIVFLAMGGINGGVVPLLLLLALPVVALDAVTRGGLAVGRVLSGLGWCLGLAVLVSTYWVVATLTALRAGEAVAGASESPRVIGSVSSFSEVLRGLGGWILYGADRGGPFRPEYLAFLTSAPVVLASFALPLLAFAGSRASRSSVRVLGVALVVLGAVVMVGLYPVDDPSPVGRVLGWAFEHVPGAVAFRTTNKAGPILVLGLVLLAALGAEVWITRLREARTRLVAAAAGSVVLALSVAPVVAGEMFVRPLDVPGYWTQAAASLDAEGAGRVWLLPGQTQSHYRWRRASVDDPADILMRRPTVVRTTLAVTGAEAANFLAAVDEPLQAGDAPPGSLSAAAGYLGADGILLRSDVVWESTGGARPGTVFQEISRDGRLRPRAIFGRPGENQLTPLEDPEASRARLTPLVSYDRDGPGAPVWTNPAEGTVLVIGDNAAVPELAGYGLLDGRRSYRLLGGLAASDAVRELEEGARVVMTDTNRRRAANPRRLDVSGPMATADEAVSPTLALFRAQDQTVYELDGVSGIRASSYGSLFTPDPADEPFSAFDGDSATAWMVGDFGRSVGQWVELALDPGTLLTDIRVTPSVSQPLRVASVDVSAGSIVRRLDLRGGAATLTWPEPIRADRLRVTIAEVTGSGLNRVGLSEVTVGGVQISRRTRLPETLSQLLTGGRGPEVAALLAKTPLDVLLRRAQAGEGEGRIDRLVDLPSARAFDVGARLIGRPPDADLDRIEGVDPSSSATASSRLLGEASFRASQAFDGDLVSTWWPDGTPAGQWVEASFAPRVADRLIVHLVADPWTGATATRVRAVLDGVATPVSPVVDGQAVIAVGRRRIGEARVEIVDVSAAGSVGIAEVEVGDGPAPARADAVPRRCEPVLQVDGRDHAVRLAGAAEDLSRPGGALAVGCDSLALAQGRHHVTASGPHSLASLYLRDRSISERTVPASVEVTDWRRSPSRFTISLAPSDDPVDLVVAESYDARWRASTGDTALGAPSRAVGFGMSWRLPAGPSRVITLEFGPQRAYAAALPVSGLGLLASGALVAVPALRRRRRRGAS